MENNQNIDDFKTATTENAKNSVKEPGIARFDVIQSLADPTRFVLVEVYRTIEDPARHFIAHPVNILVLPKKDKKADVDHPGKPVKDLQVSISMDKTRFGPEEPIPVNWKITNVGKRPRTIIWY